MPMSSSRDTTPSPVGCPGKGMSSVSRRPLPFTSSLIAPRSTCRVPAAPRTQISRNLACEKSATDANADMMPPHETARPASGDSSRLSTSVVLVCTSTCFSRPGQISVRSTPSYGLYQIMGARLSAPRPPLPGTLAGVHFV